ncbi:MAG TPA: Uma2 family endonuclease [Dehalococcoidia bacterium]|nr:Uma2 family endonuclease [Dehalococcoidia bacterium]
MGISAETYERVALEDGDATWELVCGRLRQKPPMTTAHNRTARLARRQLERQLPEDHFDIAETARLRTGGGSFYVPDLVVIPAGLLAAALAMPRELEVYEAPVPLVIEVWSPSTGDYDVSEKLPEYQRRGDAEIWLIHPHERWLRAWRRQADGGYTETLFGGEASIEPAALPGVRIELAKLLA